MKVISRQHWVEYTAALRRRGIAMVVVSGYWYMGVCARVLISRVRQVQDKSVCVRSEEELRADSDCEF